MKIGKTSGFAPLVLGLIACGAGRAESAFFTYTETATASGSLGSTNFQGAQITITATGDTNALFMPFPKVVAVPVSAQVMVSNVGVATFNGPIQVFDNQVASTAGFSDSTVRRDVLDVANPAFLTYGLTTAIGPISGSAPYFGGPGIGTTKGLLVINSVSSDVTFTATPAAVPEPASLALSGVAGLIGLGFLRARDGRAATR